MTWLSGVEQIPGNSGGSMNRDGSRKLTLHSTEGTSIEGAVAAYRAKNAWPTCTCDLRQRRLVEHLDLMVAARALQNDPGGVDQTNRDGTIHVQIEIIGFAANPASMVKTDADWDWFGVEVLRRIHDVTDVPLETHVTWLPYREQRPSSAGENNGIRMSASQWDAYSGVLAHMHVPENDHGDTGLIPIETILAAARGDDDMTPEEYKTILRNVLRQELYGDDEAHKKGITPILFRETERAFDEAGSDVRTQLAGTTDGSIVGLVELALQRSATFKALVDKVDRLG